MNATLEAESVEDLGSFLQRSVPQPKAMSRLKVNHDFGYATFAWYGREFLVNKSKQVFELRGQKLFVTALSMLMQKVINGASANQNRVSQIIHELSHAEELIINKHRVHSGLQEIDEAKRRLRELFLSDSRRY